MHLPFTAEQFVAVFARYNAATWPAPIVAYALAIAALVLALRRTRTGDRFVSLALAAMWAWTGISYHVLFFSSINPTARLFGAAFVLQAAFFTFEAFRGRLRYRLTLNDFRGRMGHVMIAFSMALYPLIGALSGHGYPSGPAFGVTPCPLVIFTFGMLLLSERSLPKYLTIIPLLWALVGSSAAVALGVREDFSLLVSGVLATTALVLRRRQVPTSAERTGTSAATAEQLSPRAIPSPYRATQSR
jgi:hypothetical protein